MKTRKGGAFSRFFGKRKSRTVPTNLSQVQKELDGIKKTLEDNRTALSSHDLQLKNTNERINANAKRIDQLITALPIFVYDLKDKIELVYNDLNNFRAMFEITAEDMRNPNFGQMGKYNPVPMFKQIIPLQWSQALNKRPRQSVYILQPDQSVLQPR